MFADICVQPPSPGHKFRSENGMCVRLPSRTHRNFSCRFSQLATGIVATVGEGGSQNGMLASSIYLS